MLKALHSSPLSQVLICLTYSLTINLSAFAQSPGGISTGLSLWLKPNAGITTLGSNLTGWTDQSPAATAVTINGSPDFVANGFNFNPYNQFTISDVVNNGGDYLRIPNANLRSFFWVAKLDNLSRSSTHLATYDQVTTSLPCSGCPIHGGSNGGSVAQYHENGYGSGNFQSAGTWRKNGDPAGIAYNSPHTGNFDIVTALGGSSVPTNVFMGGQKTEAWFNGRQRDWVGPVAEIIAFNGVITAVEANKIESYLAIKYGITLGGGGSTTLFYTSPSGNNLWTMNSGYHYQIAGIGADMALEGLNQPKSHSIHTPYDVITMANSNFTTPVQMIDGEYLLWGHNNSNLNYSCQNYTHGSPSTIISAQYNRIWRTQKTGNPSGNVIIEIDMALMQGPSGLGTAVNADIRLLIDNNSIFSDASAGEHTYSPTPGYTTSGGKIYFSVPYSDIQNGQGFFALGMASPVPISNAGTDISFCSGQSQAIGSGSTAGCTYLWSPTSGLDLSTSSNPSITLTNPTSSPVTSTYTVTTTVTATGCYSSDNIDITVNPSESAAFSLTPTCDGAIAAITGNSGGTFSFTIVPVDAAMINATSGTISNGTPGTNYQVTYTTSGSCPASLSQNVTASVQDDASFSLTPTCDGATATILGTTGGTFSFTIIPTDGATIDGVNGTISNGTFGNNYQVTYTTSGTCPATTSENINSLMQDNAGFVLTPTCDGATAMVTGTTGGIFTFTNPPVDAAILNGTTGTISNGTSGNLYEVTYTTSGTCPAALNQTVISSNLDDASFILTPNCEGVIAQITGDQGGIFSFTFSPSDSASINSITGTVSGGTPGSTYQISYTTSGACSNAANQSVTLISCEIIVPTAFTPDSDNTNDFWEIINLDASFPNNKVTIYNRWGSMIYSSESGTYNQHPWNGLYDNKELPVGSYYFIIDFNALDKEPLKGTVSIIK